MQVNSIIVIQHLLYITVLDTSNTEINNITLDGKYLFTYVNIRKIYIYYKVSTKGFTDHSVKNLPAMQETGFDSWIWKIH